MPDIEEPVVKTEPGPEEALVPYEALREMAGALYRAAGVPADDARLVAELQAETDVRGVHSHGTRALPGYIRRMQSGHTNPAASVRVVREGPSFATVDGDGGVGHLASSRAMSVAVEKAAQTGVAVACAVNSRHFGAAANYAMMALERGMVGFCVSSSSPGVAPFGGVEPLLGNNPVAYAVPAGQEYPLVLDMACGVSAWGRVGTMRMYGKRLTMDWVLDEDGKPTDDPARAHALLPFGGVKSYCFTVVMDVLAAVLPFGLATSHRGEAYSGQWKASQFFCAIKVENFVPLADFRAEVDRLVRTVRGSRRKEGVARIYLPGEIEWLKKAAWSKSGIPLHRKHVESLEAMAAELGVEVRW